MSPAKSGKNGGVRPSLRDPTVRVYPLEVRPGIKRGNVMPYIIAFVILRVLLNSVTDINKLSWVPIKKISSSLFSL